MDDGEKFPEHEARHLTYLKWLVTTLTATMILGILTIVALLVIRLQAPPPPTVPAGLDLPEGTRVTAYTQGDGWVAVVTADQRILIFDAGGGAPFQDVEIAR